MHVSKLRAVPVKLRSNASLMRAFQTMLIGCPVKMRIVSEANRRFKMAFIQISRDLGTVRWSWSKYVLLEDVTQVLLPLSPLP